MYLEKLQLQGFKSFATKTSLEFGKGIIAIVGPNGSGKSNVADAIRWVLGEQSLKLIRGKRAQDVIFAGSDRKTRLGAAEVSLYLNNEDHAAAIDFSEVVITRRVYRDGSGEYLVNKRPVRLQDIHMLLAKSNFGQRTYSVIGQGMVDTILMTSPQERKNFFDEAAGVRQYQLKRDQTVVKLDHTRDNLAQASVLLQEIEPRLRSLTRQVRRLERRSEVETELIRLQTSYYRGMLQELRTKLSSTEGGLKSLERKRAERERAVQRLNDQLFKLEQEQSRHEAFAALQRQFERAQTEKSVLLAEQAVLQGQRETVFKEQGKGNIMWLEKQLAAAKEQIADQETERTRLHSTIESEENRIQSLEAVEIEHKRTYNNFEKELRQAYQALVREAVSLPEVQKEYRDFFSLHQSFLEELRAASTLEALEALKRHGDELAARSKKLAERLGRVGASGGAEQVVELQENLRKTFSDRDEVVKNLNNLRLTNSVRLEKLNMLTTNLERLHDESDRLGRDLERSAAATKESMSATLRDQAHDIDKKMTAVDERLLSITKEIQNFNASETAKRDTLFRLQRDLRAAQDALNQTTATYNEIRVDAARLETRSQDVEKEIRDDVREEAWPAIFTSTEKIPPPTPQHNEEIMRLKHQLALIGGIDEGVEKEHQETNARYTFLKTQYDDLVKASAQLEKGIVELDRTIKERFDEAFRKINEEFSVFFKTLFQGGHAKLMLVREELSDEEGDDVERDQDEVRKSEKALAGEKVITGIEIQATPPGKRLKGVAMLSGGERALTSIALICAIISNNPTPFAVLDEVDAALDEANSYRFAAILEKLAHKTQFVMITHNRATMDKASVLYGVTMGDDGVSKLLSVKLEEAEGVIKKFGNR